LDRIASRRLPVHVTPIVREMLQEIGAAFPFGVRSGLRLLLQPALTDRVLDILGKRGARLDPLLHNAVDPGSGKLDVADGSPKAEFVVRPLPGLLPEVAITELRWLAGNRIELELLRSDPAPTRIDMGLYGCSRM
jgi:hypothetical protein